MDFITTLQQLDKELFLIINGLHNKFFDFIMYWISEKLIWIPFYLFLIVLLVKYYARESIYLIVSVIILVALTDIISVHLFKNIFLRLRPCHDPELAGLVHLVNNKCGGSYGFISSHSSNHFAMAIFITGFLGKINPLFTPGLILWAVLISYSRVYLGVHYPGDVITGALAGGILGYAFVLIYHTSKRLYLRKKSLTRRLD
jgi:undecaprenyl-diphosphatase